MQTGDMIQYLWAGGCLVALFGIWYCLWSRLPSGANPTQRSTKRLTKKEREAQERQDEIDRGIAAALAAQGIKVSSNEEVGDGLDITPPKPRVSPQPNVSERPETAAEKIKRKYTRRVEP